MKLIENYNNALQEIYDHVGFVEDWVVCPIDDATEYFWNVDVDEQIVRYADSQKEFKSQYGNYYEDVLYTQRFYEKWVYEGEKFTMVFCNPEVDGMRYFRIFDNDKRMK